MIWMILLIALVGEMMALPAEGLHFTNARILRNGHLVPGELLIKEGRIVKDADPDTAFTPVDLEGKILAPGFIDLQLNGGFGFDFSATPDAVSEVAKRLPKYGVTSFLPTIITSSRESYHQRSYPQASAIGAEPLGWHLEGPFINIEFSGMHPKDKITDPLVDSLSDVVDRYGSLDGIRMITLAPERIQNLDVVTDLVKQGIVIAMGHTAATEAQCRDCINAGASMVTHLFNAMKGLHHREPGVVGAVLSERSIHYSLIMDGCHIADTTARLAVAAHPEGLVLVTDSMQAMGLAEGRYSFGEEDVLVADGRVVLEGQATLAGSTQTMDAAVRCLVAATGCDLAYALESASLRPAEVIGVAHRKGKLEIGYDADLVVLDDALQVVACYVKGIKANEGNVAPGITRR
ncbi:Putative N-acetylglucosamine-6-phosphate deacetylase [Chlamydiales bacterium SCGC AG-110-P3]|nr:Putative N-acetylglucosamine-6-phosphate deacetylase [Chlamydiales bacterium SCGC AG-110-P3]